MVSEQDFTTDPAAAQEGKGKMADDGAVQVTLAQPSPGLDDVDCEKYGAGRESNPLPDLKRKLKSRHLQMIAIGM
jgi:amino acid transporter